jgi:hypothetical protein
VRDHPAPPTPARRPPGRPLGSGQELRQLARARIDLGLLRQLQDRCSQEGISESEGVRRAIEAWVNSDFSGSD